MDFKKWFLILAVFLLVYLAFVKVLISQRLATPKQRLNASQQLQTYQPPPAPFLKTSALPLLNATSFIIVDVDTNTILASKNASTRIYPASTTKLATALTALNLYPLDEAITVANPYKEGKIMDLQSNEKISVRSLVSGLLIFSANDAAHALAAHYQTGESGFIQQMNKLMAKYNLTSTHFVNVDGIHDPNHYTSVYDLSQLARLAIKNTVVTTLVQTPKLTVTDISGKIMHPLTTTNELLGTIPEIKGLKTGWTPEANGCFVGLIDLDHHQLISVVAASSDRFGDTKNIIDWLKKNVNY